MHSHDHGNMYTEPCARRSHLRYMYKVTCAQTQPHEHKVVCTMPCTQAHVHGAMNTNQRACLHGNSSHPSATPASFLYLSAPFWQYCLAAISSRPGSNASSQSRIEADWKVAHVSSRASPKGQCDLGLSQGAGQSTKKELLLSERKIGV